MARPQLVSNDDILRVARAAFLQHGPHVSTATIAAEVGLSQAALFKRFGTKENLLMESLAPPAILPWIPVLEGGPDDRPLEDQLRDIAQAAQQFLQELVPCISVLRAAGINIETEFMPRYEVPPPIQGIGAMAAWFDAAKAKGIVRSDVSSTTAAGMLLGLFHLQAFLKHLLEHVRPDTPLPDVDIDSAVRTLVRGGRMSWLWILSTCGAAWAGPTTVELPESYTAVRAGTDAEATWWDQWNDPTLAALIDEGLANNGDVERVWQLARQTDQVLWQVRGALLPQVSFVINEQTQPFENITFGNPALQGQTGGAPGQPAPDFPDLLNTGNAVFQGQLGLDIWGRTVLDTQAAGNDARAAEREAERASQVLASSIARTYFQVLAAAQQLTTVQDQLAANEQLLELTELRYDTGGATGLDVLQQRQQIATIRTLVPQTRQALRTAQTQLSVLVGRNPGSDWQSLGNALPTLPVLPGLGTPEDLVTQRADVRAAYARAEAARQRYQSAIRGTLPQLNLNGQAGWQFALIDGDFNVGETWAVGGSLTLPLFTGGRALGGVRAAQAGRDAAQANYKQVVRQALQEVEASVVAEAEQRAQLDAFQDQVEAASAAFEEARAQYGQGLTTYVTVLNSLNAQQQAQLNAINAQRAVLDARLTLNNALGAGWAGRTGERP